jgi:hypothetical protein
METESSEGHLGILVHGPTCALAFDFCPLPFDLTPQWVIAYMIALIPTAYPFGENR